jgi:hypothetical protein
MININKLKENKKLNNHRKKISVNGKENKNQKIKLLVK